MTYTIGIDVGTGSARAGVFDARGRLCGVGKQAIDIWHAPGGVVEQSGEQIWHAVCNSVRAAMVGIAPQDIGGIGFDATCSLVAIQAEGAPVGVGVSGDDQRNVMVWMDQRAVAEADEINAGAHDVLRYVGGRISPEMQTPKLLWLARHQPEAFARAGHFFDLADYLTWRATGSLARSACTVTCKWTYLAHEGRWDTGYFRSIGLGVLADEGFARIGTQVVAPGTALGTALGQGLTVAAAADLGLMAGTPVGAALIDAHAGGVGTLGGRIAGIGPEGRLAYIFGTSACSMATTADPVFVPGVWGPYFGAMLPGMWLNEGGQSAAGAALDHLVRLHPAAGQVPVGMSVVAWLDGLAQAQGLRVAEGLHVVPEFLGNRSPLADPAARAVVAGLGLEADVDSLVRLYVAGLCGIAYGLRQLLEAFARDGIAVNVIVASGGAAASGFVRQVLADATGVPVAVADTAEPVLLGAAMLGAVAGGVHGSVAAAMAGMAGDCTLSVPDAGLKAAHARGYAAFGILQRAGREVRAFGGDEHA